MSHEMMASSAELRSAAADLARVCTTRRCAATLRSAFNRVVHEPLPLDMARLLGKLDEGGKNGVRRRQRD